MIRGTIDAMAWLKRQHDIGSLQWRAMCLSLQRQARGLPAVFPSALAAAEGTPMRDRVYDIDKVQVGMVGYCDDPNDSNRFGHIFSFRGKNKAGKWVVWTNDALRLGGVSTVEYDWFQTHWGDKFQFAAVSLNGFDLPGVSRPADAKPSNHPEVQEVTRAVAVRYAINSIDKAMAYHKSHNHPALVLALRKDRAELVQTLNLIEKG